MVMQCTRLSGNPLVEFCDSGENILGSSIA